METTAMGRWVADFARKFWRVAVGAAFALLLGYAGLQAGPANAADEARVPLGGHTLAQVIGASPPTKSVLAGDAPMTLTIVFKRDDEAAFQTYLHDVYDSRSPLYRQFLTPAQIAERFGPSQASYDVVAAYLSAHRFDTVESAPNHMTLTVQASRSAVEDAFALNIGSYTRGDRAFFANDRDPSLPPAVAAHVQSITGLSDLAQPHALNHAQPPHYYQCPQGVDPQYCDLYGPLCAIYAGSRATGELLMDLEGTGKGPRDYAKSFNTHNKNVQDYYAACLANQFPRPADTIASALANTEPLGVGVPWSQVDGSGQVIGLVAFDSFRERDIIDYLQLIGAPANQIDNLSVVYISAGASFGAAESEVVLDIDTVMSLAPGAGVVVYSSSFDGAGVSFQRVFNRMITDGVDVISNSWAYCEDQTTRADVESIDAILQTAAVAGISAYSGSGDSGSTCLDGAANIIAVPADAPHITAVGGTSLRAGAGGVYSGETWWDGSAQTPPTSGQGGFGVSSYFTRPTYQNGFTASNMRSIPDVAMQADPANGMAICLTIYGGCPNGLLYGGTSMAAPIWAAFTSLLNQARGTDLGLANTSFYPLAASAGFHDAASMSSDFAHVGLGSPNLGVLNLLLRGMTPGPVSAIQSELLATAPPVAPFTSNYGVPADGIAPAVVIVTLHDASGNTVAGKTVALTANAGHHATIVPTSQSSRSDGVAVFKVTDLTAEELTFSATDTTDGIVVAQTAKLPFIAPSAANGGVVAFPTTQAADGTSTVTVTVTLQDALGRPSPGKQVLLAQIGHSLILGDNPGVTGSNGEAVFSVTDQSSETVSYSATDATDGDLPIPGSANVVFSNGVGCGAALAPTAAPGYKISLYASGFPTQNGVTYGGITLSGCVGVGGIAFDAAGHLFASDYVNGAVYDIPPGGATVGSGDLVTSTPLGPSLGALTLGNDGQLYGVRVATTGDFTTGAVLRIDTATGLATPVSTNLICPFNIATDPLSGDVFVSDGCFGASADNASIWRVANPGGGSPSTSIYASSNGAPNGGLSFAPDGTLYVADAYNSVVARVDQISGTNHPLPAIVQSTGIYSTFAVTALGSAPGGGARALVVGAHRAGGYDYSVAAYDMTVSPPAFSGATLEETGAGAHRVIGPDGCFYLNAGVAIYRLSNADDTCPLVGQLAPDPALVVEPDSEPAVGVQGTTQHFQVLFPHSTPALDTPVTVIVEGANSQQSVTYVGFGIGASFIYVGRNAGVDTLIAYATIDGELVASNRVQVTWTAGRHTSLLNLDASTSSGNTGGVAHAIASLADISLDPPVAIAGATIAFTLATGGCSATTDANGSASCDIVLGAPGVAALNASYAGDVTHLPTSAAGAFHVLVDSIFANGFEHP
jgi:kumamolisin